MDVAVTGATGFLGRALQARLTSDGHRVIPISRSKGPDTVVWNPSEGVLDETALEGVDAVVHLAGEGIARRPWTARQRAALEDSRISGTRTLVDALRRMERPPSVLLGASAIGFYGDRGDEVLDESSPPGDDFLAGLCRRWEEETLAASDLGIRTAVLRTGIVLDRNGGALAAQLPLFRLGLGARAGKGDQWMSWIGLRDHVSAIVHLLTGEIEGPVNLTGPEPVTNAEFTRAVGAALRRPTFLVIPRLVTKLPFGVGPLVGSLLFSSARALPRTLSEHGFEFEDRTLEDALAGVLGR